MDIPRKSPDKLIELNENIIERHEELGDDSPLEELDMAGLKNNVQQAKELRSQARDFYAKAQAMNEEARQLLGIDKGQSTFTEGTIYYMDTRIRDLLLFRFPGREEQLSTYSFNVVVSMSKLPKRKKKAGLPAGKAGKKEEEK